MDSDTSLLRAVPISSEARLARTVDAPRPQWRGLFVEPDWPPEDETD